MFHAFITPTLENQIYNNAGLDALQELLNRTE